MLLVFFLVRKPDGGQRRDAVRAEVPEPLADEHPDRAGGDEELAAVVAGLGLLEHLAVLHVEADSDPGSSLVDEVGG